MLCGVSVVFNSLGDVLGLMCCKCNSEKGQVLIGFQSTEGHLEKFFSPSRYESDSLTAMGHGRIGRASHGADGLFRC